jgi:hypothetical protein
MLYTETITEQIPLPESHEKEYYTRREVFSGRVKRIVNNMFPRVSIYGSFLTGNFHLSRISSISLSDIDITLDGETDITNRQLLALREDIGHQILERTGISVRVSIRSGMPRFDRLTRQAKKQVALIEYMASMLQTNSRLYESYSLAKLALKLVEYSNYSAFTDYNQRLASLWDFKKCGDISGIDSAISDSIELVRSICPNKYNRVMKFLASDAKQEIAEAYFQKSVGDISIVPDIASDLRSKIFYRNRT